MTLHLKTRFVLPYQYVHEKLRGEDNIYITCESHIYNQCSKMFKVFFREIDTDILIRQTTFLITPYTLKKSLVRRTLWYRGLKWSSFTNPWRWDRCYIMRDIKVIMTRSGNRNIRSLPTAVSLCSPQIEPPPPGTEPRLQRSETENKPLEPQHYQLNTFNVSANLYSNLACKQSFCQNLYFRQCLPEFYCDWFSTYTNWFPNNASKSTVDSGQYTNF